MCALCLSVQLRKKRTALCLTRSQSTQLAECLFAQRSLAGYFSTFLLFRSLPRALGDQGQDPCLTVFDESTALVEKKILPRCKDNEALQRASHYISSSWWR